MVINVKKFMKNIIQVFLVIGMLLAISACGAKESSEPIVTKEFEAMTEIKEGQPNVYLIVKALGNNYWDEVTASVQAAAQEAGCNLYSSGSRVEAEIESQIELLEQVKSNGADAVIIAPDDSTKLSGPISEVYAMGIPVVLIDTTITAEDYDICYMTDNLLAGKQAAEEMLQLLYVAGNSETEELQVAIQVGSGSSQTINERLAGFSQYWASNAPEKWTIIGEIKINEGDVDYAEQLAEEFFTTYPKIKGVFGCNNGSTKGFARAMTKGNRNDICIVGFDYSDEVATLIQNPDFNASTMLQRQGAMGQLSIQAVKDLLAGNKMEQKFVDTGVLVVNKESINSEEVQEIIAPK